MRRIAFHLVTLLFLAIAALGVRDVWNGYQRADTVLQILDLVGQVFYAGFAAAVVVLRLGRRKEARRFAWAWYGALIWAGALAPAAWDSAGWGPTLTAAGASVLIGAFILLLDAWANPRPLTF